MIIFHHMPNQGVAEGEGSPDGGNTAVEIGSAVAEDNPVLGKVAGDRRGTGGTGGMGGDGNGIATWAG